MFWGHLSLRLDGGNGLVFLLGVGDLVVHLSDFRLEHANVILTDELVPCPVQKFKGCQSGGADLGHLSKSATK